MGFFKLSELTCSFCPWGECSKFVRSYKIANANSTWTSHIHFQNWVQSIAKYQFWLVLFLLTDKTDKYSACFELQYMLIQYSFSCHAACFCWHKRFFFIYAVPKQTLLMTSFESRNSLNWEQLASSSSRLINRYFQEVFGTTVAEPQSFYNQAFLWGFSDYKRV